MRKTTRRSAKATATQQLYPSIEQDIPVSAMGNWNQSASSQRNYTPILMVALLIASFLLGMLVTKVQTLNTMPQSQQNTQGTQVAATNQSPTPPQKVNIGFGDFPPLGDKNAKVKVIEYADFQCPFCEQWFQQAEQNLIKDYVDTGKVAFAFRQYPFLGQESTWAAESAECANEQGKFWDFHNYLYNHQGSENSGAFTKDKLEGFAATIGLNTGQFNSCLESDKYSKQVAADLAEGQKDGVSGTPTTFVDGQPLVGAVPYSNLQSMIEQELKK